MISHIIVADTICEIDKVSEEAIFHFLTNHWPGIEPVEVVMEGIEEEESVAFP